MSMVVGTELDEPIIEDEDPFLSAQKDLQKGLYSIRQSFS